MRMQLSRSKSRNSKEKSCQIEGKIWIDHHLRYSSSDNTRGSANLRSFTPRAFNYHYCCLLRFSVLQSRLQPSVFESYRYSKRGEWKPACSICCVALAEVAYAPSNKSNAKQVGRAILKIQMQNL